jgi:regulation of enolase protein 1 (concanavalin A-like superfamily)
MNVRYGRAPLVALLALVLVCSAVRATAQTPPSPWVTGDIGSPALAGSALLAQGIFTVDAAGTDVWGTSDQFHFVYQPVSGNVDIIARVDSVTTADGWSKAGVMIRAGLTAGSAHGFAFASAANGAAFQRRAQTSAITTHSAGPAGAPPRWVRLVRAGTTVTAYSSANGTTWTSMGSSTIALGTTAYVGIAVTSHNASVRTTARLSQVALSGAPVTPGPVALPAGQQAADIGSPAIAGSTSWQAGSYTIRGAGTDIWDVADQFQFVYQPVTGDVDVVVRVASISAANSWSKAGVMIRESLTRGSRHAFAGTSATRGFVFRRRLTTDGLSANTAGGSGAPPGWVRLVRTGTRFEAFRSANGTTWTSMGSDVIAMGDSVYVGIAVTSRTTTAATTAVADSFKVTASAATNQPPSVSLTAPLAGAAYTAPASVALTASASDPNGPVARVDFFSGATLLASDTTAPYSASWTSVPAGTYTLTAVAYDGTGASTTSNAASITVSAAPTTTLPRAVVFQASLDHASVTSYRLDIFASGANTTTATPVATSSLAKPVPAANNDITVDRASVFTALAPGTYLATVTAIAPNGSARSLSVTFTR